MSRNSKFSPVLGAIEITVGEQLSANEMTECISESISLAKEIGATKFLVDASELIFPPSVSDIYNRIAEQFVKDGLDRESRIALIQGKSPEAKVAGRFYETVSRNRGWRVRLFGERQGAVDWLLGKTSSNSAHAGDG